jgi:hypothetical protein
MRYLYRLGINKELKIVKRRKVVKAEIEVEQVRLRGRQ